MGLPDQTIADMRENFVEGSIAFDLAEWDRTRGYYPIQTCSFTLTN